MAIKIDPVYVKMVCRVCGSDMFSDEYEGPDLVDAPGDTAMKCAYCGFETTKDELIADNSASIESAADEMADAAMKQFEREFSKALGKAFR